MTLGKENMKKKNKKIKPKQVEQVFPDSTEGIEKKDPMEEKVKITETEPKDVESAGNRANKKKRGKKRKIETAPEVTQDAMDESAVTQNATLDESTDVVTDVQQVEHTPPPSKKKKKRNKNKAKKIQGPNTYDGGAKKLSLDYLHSWDTDREKWNFQKSRQIWLLRNMYELKRVSRPDFDILLRYIEKLKGGSRDLTIQEAQKLIEVLDVELEKDPEEINPDAMQDLKAKWQRAKDILQILS